jgi:hypothetical protein
MPKLSYQQELMLFVQPTVRCAPPLLVTSWLQQGGCSRYRLLASGMARW